MNYFYAVIEKAAIVKDSARIALTSTRIPDRCVITIGAAVMTG